MNRSGAGVTRRLFAAAPFGEKTRKIRGEAWRAVLLGVDWRRSDAWSLTMHRRNLTLLVFVLTIAGTSLNAQTVRSDYLRFPVTIDGATYSLEAVVYRPDDAARHPLILHSHGRAGMFPTRDPNTVNSMAPLCRALAAEGCAVVFFVRRGYGNSDGPDSELQDTAVLSGLEAAKDYAAATAYWRTQSFVDPARVVLMGQSQGGWSALAASTVDIPGVLGVVNLSGGTNYRLMGSGAVTTAVQDHWVMGCGELGRVALVPSFWIYSENDQSINGPTARRMFNAFTAADGEGWLLMLPAYGSNGHLIAGAPELFLPQLNDFLATVGFRDEPRAAPSIVSVTGGGNVPAGGSAVLVVNLTANPLPLLRWRKDGVELRDGANIAGAASSALTISNFQASDAGAYTVVVTNSLGTATSSAATISLASTPTPTPAPAPSSGRGGGGGGACSWWCAALLALVCFARGRWRG